MSEGARRIRNIRKLAGCKAGFTQKALAVLWRMERLGHPMVVTDGFRTTAQQRALYAQGRTKPGKRVTNADGVKSKSYHQSGNAADCAFVKGAGVTWDGPWEKYGESVKWKTLRWGGDWGWDKPHMERR